MCIRDRTDAERCILEAATARMVCTGRLNPTAVVEKISKDITLFQQLPMPTKYSCMKEIDYMFRDLRGCLLYTSTIMIFAKNRVQDRLLLSILFFMYLVIAFGTVLVVNAAVTIAIPAVDNLQNGMEEQKQEARSLSLIHI